MKPKKQKVIKAWGGFIDGRLDSLMINDCRHILGELSLYASKEDAKEYYEDVRQVEIRVIDDG